MKPQKSFALFMDWLAFHIKAHFTNPEAFVFVSVASPYNPSVSPKPFRLDSCTFYKYTLILTFYFLSLKHRGDSALAVRQTLKFRLEIKLTSQVELLMQQNINLHTFGKHFIQAVIHHVHTRSQLAQAILRSRLLFLKIYHLRFYHVLLSSLFFSTLYSVL